MPFHIPAYERVTSGSCNWITTVAECETAVAALGLTYRSFYPNDGENWKSDPPYCYIENLDLKYNPGLNTGPCTDIDVCICKK